MLVAPRPRELLLLCIRLAKDVRFAPLRELLEPVKDAPVNELAEELRQELLEGEEKRVRLLLKAFFVTCDACLREAAPEHTPPGEQRRFPPILPCVSFSSFSLALPPLASSFPLVWGKAQRVCPLVESTQKRSAVEPVLFTSHTEPFALNALLPVPENSRQLSLEQEKEESIPDVPLTSRSRLGPFLKFVNREHSINVLLKHAADQYGKYLRGFGEKEAQFAACSGGPGLGKVSIVTGADLALISHFFCCRRPFVAKPSAMR